MLLVLLLVYGLSSTGASLYLHFCCGKLDEVSFTVPHKDGCNGEEAEWGGACCNNIAIDLKLDADQHPTAKWTPAFTEPVALAASLPTWIAPASLPLFTSAPWAHAPPGSPPSIPAYIQNCVFRI